MESLAQPATLGDVDENHPGSVARWMKRMGKELGGDADSDFEEAAEEALSEESESRSGESESSDQSPRSTRSSRSPALCFLPKAPKRF